VAVGNWVLPSSKGCKPMDAGWMAMWFDKMMMDLKGYFIRLYQIQVVKVYLIQKPKIYIRNDELTTQRSKTLKINLFKQGQ
jgi:hypothetical protein